MTIKSASTSSISSGLKYSSMVAPAASSSGINRNGLVIDLDPGNTKSFNSLKNIVVAKIYSTYGGERSASYQVQYSDDNSSWVTAFSGVMSNQATYGVMAGTQPGNGSYGAHRYWRYVGGSGIVSHHPRTSRIILTDINGIDHNIKIFGPDNTSDGGSIPGLDVAAAWNYDSYATTLADISSSALGGAEIIGNPSFTNNSTASYFTTDGLGNQYFNLTPYWDLLNQSEGTIGGWVRFNTQGNANYVFWTSGSPNEAGYGFMLQSESSAGLGLYLSNPGNNNSVTIGGSASAVYTGQDIYFIATYGPAGTKVYINGSLVGQNSSGPPAWKNSSYKNTYISFEQSRTRGIGGRMYMAHYYNRQLTASEVLANFNATRSRFGV